MIYESAIEKMNCELHLSKVYAKLNSTCIDELFNHIEFTSSIDGKTLNYYTHEPTNIKDRTCMKTNAVIPSSKLINWYIRSKDDPKLAGRYINVLSTDTNKLALKMYLLRLAL